MLIWQAHKGKIESAAFSADGKFLATTSGVTRAVYLWDPTTGKLVSKLTGEWPDGEQLEAVESVACAPEAPLLAAGTRRGIIVWQTGTWELLAYLSDPHLLHFHELTFGPGDRPLLAGSTASRVAVWKNAGQPTGAKTRRPDLKLDTEGTIDPEYPASSVASLHFSPDSKLLATSTREEVNLWTVSSGQRRRSLRSGEDDSEHRGAVQFSPDGSRIAMAYAGWVEVHPVKKKGGSVLKIEAATAGRYPAVWAVNWTADGKSLLTAANDGIVRLWNAKTGTELRSFDWKIGRLYCAAFSPDGLTCAAGGEKGQIVVWDVDA